MQLNEAFDYWLKASPRKDSTIRRYGASLSRLERFGLVSVEDVTRERVLEVQQELLGRGLGAVSVRTEIAALRAVVAQLEDHGRFPTGTLAEIRKVAVKLPKILRRHRVRHLGRPEFRELVRAVERFEPRIELPVLVAVWAGPRVGELARMCGEDRVGRSLAIETLPEFGEAGSCKTGPRNVPVCRELDELLRDRLPARGWLFPSSGAARCRTPFLSRWTLEEGIKHARRAAGLADDITFTVLRHTRASWWLQGAPPEGGASIYKVADWLGHTVATCERYYGSLVDGYDPDCERAPAA